MLQGHGIELQQACRGGYAGRWLTLRLQVAVGFGLPLAQLRYQGLHRLPVAGKLRAAGVER